MIFFDRIEKETFSMNWFVSRENRYWLKMSIYFTVYKEEERSIDCAWSFDLTPRVIPKPDWVQIEKGSIALMMEK